MNEREELIARLTDKDAAAACGYAARIAAESRECGRWYEYIDSVADLLDSKNSLVRNRAIDILAANARWDTEGRYAGLTERLLEHVEDEKPITARQCIKALPEIAAAKPELMPRIREALKAADASRYRDSMQPLILKDVIAALRQMEEYEND